MAREITAYLRDIIDACDSIASILTDISIDTYVEMREKRSAVEREFILLAKQSQCWLDSGLNGSSVYRMGGKQLGFAIY